MKSQIYVYMSMLPWLCKNTVIFHCICCQQSISRIVETQNQFWGPVLDNYSTHFLQKTKCINFVIKGCKQWKRRWAWKMANVATGLGPWQSKIICCLNKLLSRKKHDSVSAQYWPNNKRFLYNREPLWRTEGPSGNRQSGPNQNKIHEILNDLSANSTL